MARFSLRGPPGRGRALRGRLSHPAIVASCSVLTTYLLLCGGGRSGSASSSGGFWSGLLSTKNSASAGFSPDAALYRFMDEMWHLGLPGGGPLKPVTPRLTASTPPAPREGFAVQETPANMPSYIQSYAPTFACPNEERVGRNGDGAKWMCQPRTLLKAPCLVYSFGSRLDLSFEEHVAALAPCEIHIFDPTPSLQAALPSLKLPPHTTFHSFGLVGPNAAPLKLEEKVVETKTLPQIMANLSHTHIDVLKIDIEVRFFCCCCYQ